MPNRLTKHEKYGLCGMVRLLSHLLKTRLFFPEARLIRFPIDVRGRKYIDFGRGLTTGYGCRIEAFPLNDGEGKCIVIGENVQINDYVHIGAVGSIKIGNNVLMASKIYITDHNHGSYDELVSDSPYISPINRKPVIKPVIIGDNVWIGESACIMPGVKIGQGSIIGALSIVTKDIPPFSIAVGNPARVIKKYNFDQNIWVPTNKKDKYDNQ